MENSTGAGSIHQGQIVAHYREAMHWTQQRLADELGVDLRTVQRMEQRPMIKSLKRRQFLVELLGIPAIFMFASLLNRLAETLCDTSNTLCEPCQVG